jgi:hypothetical protein
MNSHNRNSCCGFASLPWFIIGALTSWVLNHSLPWAIVHGICGGFYLVYALFFRWMDLERVGHILFR